MAASQTLGSEYSRLATATMLPDAHEGFIIFSNQAEDARMWSCVELRSEDLRG